MKKPLRMKIAKSYVSLIETLITSLTINRNLIDKYFKGDDTPRVMKRMFTNNIKFFSELHIELTERYNLENTPEEIDRRYMRFLNDLDSSSMFSNEMVKKAEKDASLNGDKVISNDSIQDLPLDLKHFIHSTLSVITVFNYKYQSKMKESLELKKYKRVLSRMDSIGLILVKYDIVWLKEEDKNV